MTVSAWGLIVDLGIFHEAHIGSDKVNLRYA